MSLELIALPGWLAAGLVALVAATLTGLYRLRPPPRRVAVPSNLLWRRAAARRPARRERLRWWLSLLLAIAIGALLAGALAEPVWRGDRLAIVIDSSPTMATRTGDGRTRLERARDEAARLVARQGGEQLLVTSTCALDAPARSGGPREAREALAAIEVCAPDELRFPELSTAGARRVLITDGVWDLALPDDVQRMSVFEPAANVGITGLSLEAAPVARERALSVEIANGSADPRHARLEVRRGDWVYEAEFRLGPGEVRSLERVLPPLAQGPLEATLRADGDALPLDDRAWLWLGRPPLRVRLVGAGHRSLETALRLDPGLALERVAAGGWDAPGAFDALVFEAQPNTEPDRPSLAFQAGTGAGAAPGSLIGAWRREHAVLSRVWLDDLEVRSAARLRASRGDVLARVQGEPVIVASSLPVRAVRVAFGLDESSWPSSPDFPVFVASALAWAAGPTALDTRLGLVELPLPDADVVRGADGAAVPSQPGSGTTRFVARAPGLYAASRGERTVRVAASLLDRRASGVNRSTLGGAAGATSTARAGGAPPGPLWLALLALATLLLVAEFWSYRRRLTV